MTRLWGEKYFPPTIGSESREDIFMTNDPIEMLSTANKCYGAETFISGVYGRSGCPLTTPIGYSSGSRFGSKGPKRETGLVTTGRGVLQRRLENNTKKTQIPTVNVLYVFLILTKSDSVPIFVQIRPVPCVSLQNQGNPY